METTTTIPLDDYRQSLWYSKFFAFDCLTVASCRVSGYYCQHLIATRQLN